MPLGSFDFFYSRSLRLGNSPVCTVYIRRFVAWINYTDSYDVFKVLCFLRRPQNLTKSSLSIWRYVVNLKSTVKISLTFVTFLENMNFNCEIWGKSVTSEWDWSHYGAAEDLNYYHMQLIIETTAKFTYLNCKILAWFQLSADSEWWFLSYEIGSKLTCCHFNSKKCLLLYALTCHTI